MAAKAILSAKLNSFPFEDRVIVLEVPAKIGRSHKDDQVKTGFFNSSSEEPRGSINLVAQNCYESYYFQRLGSEN